MEAAIEIAAKAIFETWGGPWALSPEHRKNQARKEALLVFEAIRDNQQAASEMQDFITRGPEIV